jgi:hypothetical protein
LPPPPPATPTAMATSTHYAALIDDKLVFA